MKQLFLRYNTLFLVHILLALLVWPTDQLDVSITRDIPASIGTLILLENHVAHAEASANKVRVLYIFFLDILCDFNSYNGLKDSSFVLSNR